MIQQEALNFFLSQKQEQRLSYIDCLQVLIAQEEKMGIITFDKKIMKVLTEV